ncbi:hypothetical protein U9M48_034273 [Paspalum notatum var. saurae]|uniref:Uncharacterized protein n=1 Tax=Paspalum notatum var. saurae TaxID=547442 RepID=A0AAQ3UAE1_PASNO
MAAASGHAPRVTCALLHLLLLVVGVAAAEVDHSSQGQASVPSSWSPAPAPSPMNEYDRLRERVRGAAEPVQCRRACGSCCARCHCVPPGTAGNHHVCPCYAATDPMQVPLIGRPGMHLFLYY